MSLIFIGLLERKEKKTFIEATREFDWPYLLCVAAEDQNCGRQLIEVVLINLELERKWFVICPRNSSNIRFYKSHAPIDKCGWFSWSGKLCT
jgi:hypothetical protein